MKKTGTPMTTLRRFGALALVAALTAGLRFAGFPPFQPNEVMDYTLTSRHVRQPLDHAAPQGPQFDQQVNILVPDGATRDAPVFFVLGNETHMTNAGIVTLYRAYGSPKNVIFIQAEHRGYGTSISADPDQSRPTYVTYTQALADYHQVVETFKPEFTGPWIGAGYSYGGGLSIQFGLSYPQDVKAVLSSSGVVDWKFAIPEYDRQVRRNLGPALYQQFTDHVAALQPKTLYDQVWMEREMLYAFVVAMTQYQQYQRLKPAFLVLAHLPTPLFITTLRWLDQWIANGQAWNYAVSNSKAENTRGDVLSGKYDWRTWRYAQCTETGTFFVSAETPGLFTATREEFIAGCKALFGTAPQTANQLVWKLRDQVKGLKAPLVHVAGGKDPWKALGITSQDQIPNGKYIYAEEGFHCPDRNDRELGRQVLAALLDAVKK